MDEARTTEVAEACDREDAAELEARAEHELTALVLSTLEDQAQEQEAEKREAEARWSPIMEGF